MPQKNENPSVSGVTTICITQCNTSSHRVDQVVDCGMLVHSSSMAVRSCWILAGTGTCCRMLCTDPYNMGPCIIMLQHEVIVVDEWHNNGPQYLVPVSLCIQNAINKMHLCSLSITYACPYHNPTATMGHSNHNLDIRKPLTHTTPYTLSAICPVQWKPGFIREENTSPKCQTLNVSICPLKSVTMMNCSQVETPMRMTSMLFCYCTIALTQFVLLKALYK